MTKEDYARIHTERLRKRSKQEEEADVVAVRFFSDRDKSLSKKRYCYFTDIHNLNPGDHVIVNVCGTEKTTVVVVSGASSLVGEDYIYEEEKEKATKWVVRRATVKEINREYK